MRGEPRGAWGKLKRDETGVVETWHPLIDHCADVAACCGVLLKHSLIGRRLAVLSSRNRLSEVQISRLSVLAGMHDIGKYNHGFQARMHYRNPNTAGHVMEMLALMDENGTWTDKLVDALDYRNMLAWVDEERTLFSYLRAMVAHHGRPHRAAIFRSILWKPSNGLDPIVGITELRKCLHEWFPEACQTGGEILPAATEFQHAFYGLVTLADWIASDEYLFPYSEESDGDRMDIARSRAREALALLWLEPGANCDRLEKTKITFEQILPGKQPRPLQSIMNDLDLPPPGSVTVLEAQTGSGKTEASLLYFLKLFRAGQVDGLYFALPTRTAATQIHSRIKDIVNRVFLNERDCPPVVMAVPGYLQVDDIEGQRILASFDVIWNDDENERFRYRGWAAENPKRYLAGMIVVGTIDQVLLSSLQVNHSHMRAVSLLRHLLIVDEVHASDLYMNRLLKVVLDRHRMAGGHALLMSATLGSETRMRLLGDASKLKSNSLACSIEECYPRLAVHSITHGEQMVPISHRSASKVVRIDLEKAMNNPSIVASMALRSAMQGGRILILRNTVKACLATQRELEDIANNENRSKLLHHVNSLCAPHHSRYARQDRLLIDNALEKQFGKDRPTGGCVAVATQTVQQSLDLDADLLITDLCPMDVLLQRIGRLHRHFDRTRPEAVRNPRIIVLIPEIRDMTPLIRRNGEVRGANGIGTVYDDLRIIEATWRQLETRELITIPNENRELVETSLHSYSLQQIIKEMGDKWCRHQQYVEGSAMADKLMAHYNITNWKDDFLSEKILFASGVDTHISTRLGEGDRRVMFDSEITSPFGVQIREITIPCWMCRNVERNSEPCDVHIEDNSVFFQLGDHHYIYDRMGLRPVAQDDYEREE